MSKNTDFVMVGAEPGSKYEKAKELGVKIIGEKSFEIIGIMLDDKHWYVKLQLPSP